jgi:hypothetical protein
LEKSICESGMLARRFSFRRSPSLMRVVKSALAGTRLSCRDNADFFFAMLFLARVDDNPEFPVARAGAKLES